MMRHMSITVSVAVSRQELDLIESKAKQLGISKNQFMKRSAIEKCNVPEYSGPKVTVISD